MQKPCHWNAADKCTYVDIHPDSLKAGYNGPGKSENDAAAVRANCCIPSNCGVFYWEVQILCKGRDGHIGIGVATGTFPLSRLPGWDLNSIGYHGDDGFCFVGTGHGVPFGPGFSTGDVVGCGVDFVKGEIFFTKNSVYLGSPASIEEVFKNAAASQLAAPAANALSLFPIVGFRTPGEVIKGNFGSEAFAFDIQQYSDRLRFCQRQQITKHQIPRQEFPYAELSMKCIILEYLISEGCWQTAEAFWREAFAAGCYHEALEAPMVTEQTRSTANLVPTRSQLEQQLQLVKQRKELMQAVLAGDIQNVLHALDTHYPNLLANNRNLAFRLHTQQFIHLLQTSTTEKMLEFGRFLAQEYQNDPPEFHTCLNSLFALVGYAKNQQMHQQLQASTQSSLQSTCSLLNSTILREYERRPSIARLQRLVQQTEVTLQELNPFL